VDIQIREATIDELPALLELNQKIFVKNPQFDRDLILDFSLTPEGIEYFKKEFKREDGCFLFAEQNGKLIGYVNGGSKKFAHRKSKYFEIDNLGVIPEEKGKGIGKLLLDKILEWAKRKDYQKIYLNCYAKNSEALSFYKKSGFNEIDIGLEKTL